MELKDLRCEIDKIDDQLVKLFVQRMEISAQVAAYKKEHQLPILSRSGSRKSWLMWLKRQARKWKNMQKLCTAQSSP